MNDELDNDGFLIVTLHNDTPAVAIYLAIEPHGTALFYAEDDSDDSRAMLNELREEWQTLWPDMLHRFMECAKDLDKENALEGEITGAVARLGDGVFMADRCDTYISLEGDEAPQWDYFLKDGKIIHFQPVF